MVRIEIEIDPQVLRELLRLIRSAADSTRGELMVETGLEDCDADLAAAWEADLRAGLEEDCDRLLELFRDHFRAGRGAEIEDEVADAVVRACSALRLKLRRSLLKRIKDRELEAGDPPLARLTAEERQGYYGYLFLAGLQQLILVQIDPEWGEL